MIPKVRLADPERRMRELSRAHLKVDLKMKILPKTMYERILREGVPCAHCGFVINEDTYGEVVRNPKRPKAICYYCTTVSDF